MMSSCNTCRNKFTVNILNKVIDKKKKLNGISGLIHTVEQARKFFQVRYI